MQQPNQRRVFKHSRVPVQIKESKRGHSRSLRGKRVRGEGVRGELEERKEREGRERGKRRFVEGKGCKERREGKDGEVK